MSNPMLVPAPPNGTRFGRLTVKETVKGNGSGGRICICRCSCGVELRVRAVELRGGYKLSCPGPHACSACGVPVRYHGEWSHWRKHQREMEQAA